jgi:hypothetical protein
MRHESNGAALQEASQEDDDEGRRLEHAARVLGVIQSFRHGEGHCAANTTKTKILHKSSFFFSF